MPLTPEEEQALVNGTMSEQQMTEVSNKLSAEVWEKYTKKYGHLPPIKAKLSSKKWPPPKVVKKPAPTEHWHDLAKPEPFAAAEAEAEKKSWWDAEIEYVDADVDYPIVEKFTEELEHMKVPMQTRRSNKRVGLTCKAVQLLSKSLDTTCCAECHDFGRRRPDHHQMQWVTTPAYPTAFDVGQAFVCCHYRTVCQHAVAKGWDKLADKAQHMDPAKVWETLISHANGPGSYMNKVVELTWLTSGPTYNANLLEEMGLQHLPQMRVQVKSKFTSAAAIPEEFCNNPRCVTCAWDVNSYWSFGLQCWMRFNLYSIFDNALKLSKGHEAWDGHLCGGTAIDHTLWIPEPELWTCRYMEAPHLPVWGAQYDADPRYHACIKFSVQGDLDGFRWILHAPDKQALPKLSAQYQYLIYEVVGL